MCLDFYISCVITSCTHYNEIYITDPKYVSQNLHLIQLFKLKVHFSFAHALETNTPITARVNPEDQEHNILNPGEDNHIPSPRNSPRNSLTSSKSVKIDGKTYQVRKQRINRLLQDIEENALQNHSEHLEKQATLL